jgi:hypothetical protein
VAVSEMKSGKSVRIVENACLNCGKVLDGATAIDQEGEIRPTPGSITVCMYCGHLMAFDEQLHFRALTDEEIINIAGDERLIAINRARTLSQITLRGKK